ncbi:MAG: sugar ABC transporter substrate-binding protein [bacterium]|nr:sugar ABC transporter substrate-binding protein [bacterium]
MKLKSLLVFLTAIILCVLCMQCAKKEKGDRQVLRYSAPGFVLYNTIRENAGKEFEKKHPGVKTIYEPISGQGFFEKLLTQLASGTEPDIFFMRDFELPNFVQKGSIMELNGFIENDPGFDLKDYHKILIDSYTVNNKIYGLPGSFTSGVIFYNKDILARAGMKPMNDLSWDKLLKAGQQLTIRSEMKTVKQFGIVLEYYDWITFILQNEGSFFSPDKKKCILNSPQAAEAVDFLKSLIKTHHITPSMVDLEQAEAYSLFMLNRAALFTGGRWYTTIFKEIKNFQWGIMPFFYNKKKSVRLDSHSWVISQKAKDPKLAWEFLKFLTSRDSNWKMVEVGDSVPIHRSNLRKFIKMNPENKVFVDSLDYAYTVDKIMTPYVTWREMQTILREEFDKFILDQQNSVNTLMAIDSRINEKIKANMK